MLCRIVSTGTRDGGREEACGHRISSLLLLPRVAEADICTSTTLLSILPIGPVSTVQKATFLSRFKIHL